MTSTGHVTVAAADAMAVRCLTAELDKAITLAVRVGLEGFDECPYCGGDDDARRDDQGDPVERSFHHPGGCALRDLLAFLVPAWLA